MVLHNLACGQASEQFECKSSIKLMVLHNLAWGQASHVPNHARFVYTYYTKLRKWVQIIDYHNFIQISISPPSHVDFILLKSSSRWMWKLWSIVFKFVIDEVTLVGNEF